MDRQQLIIATALALIVVFALGWLAGAVLARLGRSSGSDLNEIGHLARQLARTEAAHDDAVARLGVREASLNSDLDNSLEALREARLEIEELRAYIDKHLAQN